MLSAIGRIIGYTFVGTLVLPLATLLLIIPFYLADKRCGTPGDSGGCEMGFASVLIMAVPAGAMLGFAFGLWRAVRKRRLAEPSS